MNKTLSELYRIARAERVPVSRSMFDITHRKLPIVWHLAAVPVNPPVPPTVSVTILNTEKRLLSSHLNISRDILTVGACFVSPGVSLEALGISYVIDYSVHTLDIGIPVGSSRLPLTFASSLWYCVLPCSSAD
ncbi:hypothetical protein AVEN_14918-1 [Araneus ventricosus]|uniref:Uncharacterized protein n=1 Tax=Araneus ventricosus TaxID=182803 RepID=A0A4Y2JP46_ARAVE|nr:hypothetical protein AVEN_14918-1 [Araneus ventricosus]